MPVPQWAEGQLIPLHNKIPVLFVSREHLNYTRQTYMTIIHSNSYILRHVFICTILIVVLGLYHTQRAPIIA